MLKHMALITWGLVRFISPLGGKEIVYICLFAADTMETLLEIWSVVAI